MLPQQVKLDSSHKQPIEKESGPSLGPDTAYHRGNQTNVNCNMSKQIILFHNSYKKLSQIQLAHLPHYEK